MHLGNARTALLSGLLAWHEGGHFLLRIEDTDEKRSDPQYTEALIADLRWLGLMWQEGPHAEKGNGPYWQSERQAIYDYLYTRLKHSGDAYPCFCSETELKLARERLLRAGRQPRYPGTCRHLTPTQAQEKLAAGLKPTLRFSVSDRQKIAFEDMVKGPQRFSTRDIGDFVIRRADGTPSFLFCNAVDDSLMGVTHVLRGEDHLTNTPRQLMLLTKLEMRKPVYGHISLILGQDGSPLSKRHGSFNLQDLKRQGYLPLAIINYMARLGHCFEKDMNILMDLPTLAQGFRVSGLGTAPARFDEKQLFFWQKQAVCDLDDQALWAWLGGTIQNQVPEAHRADFISLIRPNITFPEQGALWANALFGEILEHNEEGLAVLQETDASFFDAATNALSVLREQGFKAWCEAINTRCNVSGKQLFLPLRIALTGQAHGPELAAICALFDTYDKNWLPNRLKQAQERT